MTAIHTQSPKKAGLSSRPTIKKIVKCWQLYLFILVPVILVIVFSYVPMYGITLAFKDYSIRDGILGSPWVGFKYFGQFFRSPNFVLLLKNTLLLSIYSLVASFPIPIILALALNEVRSQKFKKTVQMITYAPYFISTVILVGMLIQILSTRGIVNHFLSLLGIPATDFMGKSDLFRSIYVWSGVWQGSGYSAIIYIAALSAVDPSLYEAATIDGITRIKKIIYIDFPTILPTITLLLIMSVGGIMSIGYEKVYLMQNNLNSITSEIISTYVYKIGLINGQYSFSTAVGLFNSVINFILLFTVNQIARKTGETSLW